MTTVFFYEGMFAMDIPSLLSFNVGENEFILKAVNTDYSVSVTDTWADIEPHVLPMLVDVHPDPVLTYASSVLTVGPFMTNPTQYTVAATSTAQNFQYLVWGPSAGAYPFVFFDLDLPVNVQGFNLTGYIDLTGPFLTLTTT